MTLGSEKLYLLTIEGCDEIEDLGILLEPALSWWPGETEIDEAAELRAADGARLPCALKVFSERLRLTSAAASAGRPGWVRTCVLHGVSESQLAPGMALWCRAEIVRRAEAATGSSSRSDR